MRRWELDVDPAQYARGLMQASLRSCTALKAEFELRPQNVLNEAWHKMHEVGTRSPLISPDIP